ARHFDVEAGIAGHVEGFAGGVGLPFSLALHAHAAASGHAFHDLGRAGVEGERGREDDADGLLRAIVELDSVADALAVEVDVGLGGDGDAVDLGGDGHELQIPYSIPSNFWMMPLATKPTKPTPRPRNIHIVP